MRTTAIYGPPGTGKTTHLVNIAKHIDRKMLYLSFTKAAAIEATSRLKGHSIVPSTVHSFAFAWNQFNSSQVIDWRKKIQFSQFIGIPVKGADDKDETQLEEGDFYFQVLNYANHRKITLDQAYDAFGRPGSYARFYLFTNAYREWKDASGYVDFDDMLFRFLQDGDIPGGYPVVMLDEAQDCSPLIWDCFTKIIQRAEEVYVAGDDDQAIFEWSGANPHGMADFRAKTSTTLDRSFRVPRRVHFLVHDAILNRFERRVDKPFTPANRDGGVVRYGNCHDFPFDSFRGEDLKILVRDKFQQLEIQRILNAAMIPYSVAGGTSPWTSRVAKEIRNGKPLRDMALSLSQMDFYAHADLTEPVTIEVSTIHQAKGKEAQFVMVDCSMTNAAIENFERNPDAERRVWYTACTRAKEELYICGENVCI